MYVGSVFRNSRQIKLYMRSCIDINYFEMCIESGRLKIPHYHCGDRTAGVKQCE